MRLAVAVALTLGLVVAPAHAAKRHTCKARGSETVRADEGGRVYTREHPRTGYETHYACSYRSGTHWDMNQDDDNVTAITLASPYVAFLRYNVDSHIASSDLYVLDMRTGRERFLAEFRREPDDPAGEDFGQAVLSRSGAVAWTTVRVGDGATRLSKRDRDGRAVLDPGPGVDAGSLALSPSGRRLYWSNAGEPRTSRLR